MWLSLILRNWQLAVIALLSLALTLSHIHGRYLKSELSEKIAEIEAMKSAAIEYSRQSEASAKEISDAFKSVVDKNKANETALKAARARFGSCHASRGAPAIRLPAQHGSGQADSTGEPDGATEERVAVPTEFINDCAADAARINAWRSWAVKNELPVSKD
jgi:hypothetical protein